MRLSDHEIDTIYANYDRRDDKNRVVVGIAKSGRRLVRPEKKEKRRARSIAV